MLEVCRFRRRLQPRRWTLCRCRLVVHPATMAKSIQIWSAGSTSAKRAVVEEEKAFVRVADSVIEMTRASWRRRWRARLSDCPRAVREAAAAEAPVSVRALAVSEQWL